jgi:TonB-dependent starch-binding outer membrane protein SusC
MKRFLQINLAVTVLLAVTALAAPAQQIGSVSGTVLDNATNRPLSGAYVTIPGTGITSLTREDGRFNIPNAPAGEVRLRAQLIGYATVVETVQVVAGETTTVEFRLASQAIGLREVVVTGTAGEMERRAMGTVIASVDVGQVMERQHITSVDQLLQSRVPGMNVYAPQGAHGIGGVMQIRGLTSVTLNSDPVIYIDGVRVDGSHDRGAEWIGGQHPSRLQDISPQDIERIEIVKGAAASTLYGTQGANGVIQIFTRRGSAGAPQWTLEMSQGYERMATDTFPGRLFTEFHGPPDPVTGEVFWAQDPIQEVSRGHHQRYALSVAGGGENIRYFASGLARTAETSVRPETNWEKHYAGRANIDALVTSNLRLSFNSSLSFTTSRIPRGENAWEAIYPIFASAIPYTARPDRPYGEAGNSIEANTTMEHMLGTRRITAGVTMDHNPMERFSHRATVGVDQYTEETTTFFPFGYEGMFYELGSKLNSTRQFRDITVDYRASYDQPINPTFNLRLAAGAQGNLTDQTRIMGIGSEFPGPGLSTVSAGAITSASESRVEHVNAGVFAEQTLEVWDRLFLITGLRLDGNSAFGNEFQYQVYPKASLAYNISDEVFWPTDWIPTMKLRVAFGAAGRAPSQFAADRTYSPVAAKDGQPAVTPANLGDPNLGPERSQELELGFDAGFWDNRIGLEFTVWRQKTKDALLSVAFPASQGFLSSQLTNLGELRNDGVEMMVNTLLVRRPGLEWDLTVQAAHQTSELLDLGGLPPMNIRVTRLEEGFPINGIWANRLEWDPVTRTHSIVSDGREYVGPADPVWTGSVNNNVRWNRLTFTGNVGFAMGHYRASFQHWWDTYTGTGDMYLSLVERPTGAPTAASDSLWNYALEGGSHIFNYKGDFVRLRELAVTYDIPSDWVSGLRMRRASVRLSGRNLWHWTAGPWMDPEVGYYGSSHVGRGMDWNSTPLPRVYMLSFRTTF